GLLIYAACALVIPNEGDKESIASDVLRNHRQRPIALIGLVLAAIAGIALLSHISIRFHSDAFWVGVLLVGGILIWAQARSPAAPGAQAPSTAAPGETRRSHGVLWIVLAVVAALLLAAAI